LLRLQGICLAKTGGTFLSFLWETEPNRLTAEKKTQKINVALVEMVIIIIIIIKNVLI